MDKNSMFAKTNSCVAQSRPGERPKRTGFARQVIFFLMLLPALFSNLAAHEKVSLQLKWQHQFQFAGYYAAQEQGYYRSAGLEVEIIPCHAGRRPRCNRCCEGKAEFGVGATELLLLREQGVPVVVLAVIFQHSPLALMTLKTGGLQSIHDLAGRKVMIEPGSSELFAYLNKEGISADKFTLLPHDFSSNDCSPEAWMPCRPMSRMSPLR